MYCPNSIIYRRCRVNLEVAHFKNGVPTDMAAKATAVEGRIKKYRLRGFTIFIEPEMSDGTLFAYFARTRNSDDQNDLADSARVWNLFWANKRN